MTVLFNFIFILYAQDVNHGSVPSSNADTTATLKASADSTHDSTRTRVAAPTNLSEINSPQSDYAPFITPDGKTLYFSSSREGGYGGEDIYYSTLENGYWSPPKNLGPPINSPYNEGAMCLSPDGKTMYITICGRPDSYGECDIYVSVKQGETWSEPKNLGKNVNSTWWDGHPTLSPTGDTLYFASDRFGGFGGMDLYFTYKTPNGWARAKNFGYPINNARDQTSPFMHIDGRTLYFSSAGHGGLGGLDVFLTRYDTTTGHWSKPINLGPPINTSGNDYFFSVPGAGDYIFFASDRPGGYGGFDIYSYPLQQWQKPQVVATLVGKVVDATTGEPVYATVTIERLRDGTVVQTLKTDSLSGEFFVVLPAGEMYGISVSAPGYAFASENYEVKPEQGFNELHHTFKLKRIEIGSIVSLVNIFFDFGKYDLRPESEPELERIYELMKQYPEMKIEVQGFADSIGSSEFNLYLSRMRAKAVRDWLVQHGIDSTRIRYVGYGEEERGATEEELQQSRRVQFKIIQLGSKVAVPISHNPAESDTEQSPQGQDTTGQKPELEDTTHSEIENPKMDFLIDSTLTLEEYKKLFANANLDSLAEQLFEKFILSDESYHPGDIQRRPVAVKTAALGYPQAARALGVEGIVLVEFTLDTLGQVVPGSAKILKALPPGVFEGAAIAAIYHWRYTPAVDKKGRKIQTRWIQPLVFKAK